MSDKKKKEALIKKAKQVLVVGACVLFVVLMILSGMSSHWLTIFTVIKPGDTVVVDYTLYDATGNVFLTSSQQTYTQETAKNKIVIYSKQLSMVADQNLSKFLYPVSIYTNDGGWTTKQFALFSTEFNAMSKALVGMKTGDKKHVQIPDSSIAQSWSAESLKNSGVNMTDLRVGDLLPMGVSDKPEEMATNSTTTYTRIGEITNMTDDGIIVDSGYPSVDISIVSINANS
jgi:FKBP-type peptidyl-prolyl cis-trans isomerase 2